MIERQTLTNEHRAIVEVAGRLVRAIDEPAFDISDVLRMRWRLAHLLAVHLAKEDRLVYPRLKACDDTKLAALAERYQTETGGLSGRYGEYMSDWDADRIAADRPGFAGETRELVGVLERRIEREELELYPLYERVGPTCQTGA